jgi:hypothetical protein
MKTILDKVDPKYFECLTGTCEHTIHATNGVMWIVAVALILLTGKYYYAIKDSN